MPLEKSRRGRKAPSEEQKWYSKPSGQVDEKTIRMAMENATKDPMVELIAACHDFLDRAGLPNNGMPDDPPWPVLWSLENPGEWDDAPDGWGTTSQAGYKLGTVADATRRGLVAYDSPVGFAARILDALRLRSLAQANGELKRVERLTFRAGVLAGWAGFSKPTPDHRFRELVRGIVEANPGTKPRDVWKMIAGCYRRRTEDTECILEMHDPDQDSPKLTRDWTLELRGGRTIIYETFSRRVRRARRALNDV